MTRRLTEGRPRPEGGGENSPPPWGAGRGRTGTLRAPEDATRLKGVRPCLRARAPITPIAHRRNTDVKPTSDRRPKTASFAP